jgi:hypothetical protein
MTTAELVKILTLLYVGTVRIAVKMAANSGKEDDRKPVTKGVTKEYKGESGCVCNHARLILTEGVPRSLREPSV